MPRPTLLPPLNWAELFGEGLDYAAWLDAAENTAHREKMDEFYDRITLSEADEAILRGIDRAVYVVAIAEDWCPDVVRHVPILMKMADASDYIEVRFITREASLDTFARFLTVGGEAIPKFIFLSDKFVECGSWGPMQEDCRALIARGKACGDMKTARVKVFERYKADPERKQVLAELRNLFEVASCPAP